MPHHSRHGAHDPASVAVRAYTSMCWQQDCKDSSQRRDREAKLLPCRQPPAQMVTEMDWKLQHPRMPSLALPVLSCIILSWSDCCVIRITATINLHFRELITHLSKEEVTLPAVLSKRIHRGIWSPLIIVLSFGLGKHIFPSLDLIYNLITEIWHSTLTLNS